jgi:aromatic-L-amino-acid/L-tryptophan decarboxylase
MNPLLEEIKALQITSATLEPTEAERTSLLQKVNALSNDFINTISTTPSYSNEPLSKDLNFKKENQSIETILDLYKSEVASKGINAASGGHLGYIPGGGIYTSSLGDYLADVTNEYAGSKFASPGGVAIEDACINWMKSVFNFPSTAVGNLTSGGSIANLIALTAARDKRSIKGDKIEKSVVYLSEQVHHCIHKALRIIGLGDIIIREIALDKNSRIKTDALLVAIENDKGNGLIPSVVIASAGTTDTGAVDPLYDIGQICQSNNLWYHIDGAYGGFFILVDKIKDKFKGIEMADSLVVDPHKGLFLPYGIGAVLVKDQEAVMLSHHYMASYMQDTFDENHVNSPMDLSPELTKHFRGMRMWLPLQLHGVKPFSACLEEKLLLVQYFRDQIQNIGFEVGPEPDLSVSYFWFPKAEMQNEYNQKLMNQMMEDGEIFFSSTTLKGNFVIRVAVLSFRTKIDEVDRAIQMIKRARIKIDNR